MSDKIIKNHNEDEISKILMLKRIRIGYSKDDFMMNFQGEEMDLEQDSKKDESYNVIIPKQYLKRVIVNLIEAGAEYQEQYGEDIGLPTREED